MTIYGYARVSTDGPSSDDQSAPLRAAGCQIIFRETVSGARAGLRERDRLLATMGTGDVLVVTRLDRLARSMRELVGILGLLAERNTTFRSLHEPWADTTIQHRRPILDVLSGLAAFERDLVQSRTAAGRERARASGQHMGRPFSLTPHQRQEALRALAAGTATQADLARRYKVSQSTISRLAEQRVMIPSNRTLDPHTRRAAKVFLERLEGEHAPFDALVYGSRARGDHRPDSDADIAVILKGRRGDRYEVLRSLSDVAYDVMLETGIHIQPLPLWDSELEQPELFGNPALIETIKREGLRP